MMVVLNIILLNLLWIACVLGASNGWLWPSIVSLCILLLITYIYAGINRKDFNAIVFSLIFGSLIDGFLQGSGLLIYASPFHQVSYLPPVWILILWIGFAASIKTGMQWFLYNPVIGTVIMTIGAPVSYYSASRLGAVSITSFEDAMLVIAVGWLIYFVCITQFFYPKGSRKDVMV